MVKIIIHRQRIGLSKIWPNRTGNKNETPDGITNRLKLENPCPNLVKNILTSPFVCKSLKNEKSKRTALSSFCMGVKILLHLKKSRELKALKNSVLIRISGPNTGEETRGYRKLLPFKKHYWSQTH